MIVNTKLIDNVTYTHIRAGVQRVMVVDCPNDKFYYRKAWQHNYKSAGSPKLYAGSLFVDLPLQYFTDDFVKFWEKLHYGGSSGSPQSYTRQIPELQTMVKHPHNDSYMDTLESIIIQLNDTAKWTREQIADWLETLDVNPILNNTKETV